MVMTASSYRSPPGTTVGVACISKRSNKTVLLLPSLPLLPPPLLLLLQRLRLLAAAVAFCGRLAAAFAALLQLCCCFCCFISCFRSFGMVMVGWLGRACTALHCTHYAHTQAQETPQCLFLFLSSSFSVSTVFCDCKWSEWQSLHSCTGFFGAQQTCSEVQQ